MRHASPRTALMALALLGPTITWAAASRDPVAHERKEVAGLGVVFGAEPEPALTDEMQFLRWRVSSLADQTPFTQFQDAAVTITREGKQYGPFPVRPVRREPGLYQTQHIFTAEGAYQSVLTFRKGEDRTTHSVDFSFRIRGRASLEIPRRKPA